MYHEVLNFQLAPLILSGGAGFRSKPLTTTTFKPGTLTLIRVTSLRPPEGSIVRPASPSAGGLSSSVPCPPPGFCSLSSDGSSLLILLCRHPLLRRARAELALSAALGRSRSTTDKPVPCQTPWCGTHLPGLSGCGCLFPIMMIGPEVSSTQGRWVVSDIFFVTRIGSSISQEYLSRAWVTILTTP